MWKAGQVHEFAGDDASGAMISTGCKEATAVVEEFLLGCAAGAKSVAGDAFLLGCAAASNGECFEVSGPVRLMA